MLTWNLIALAPQADKTENVQNFRTTGGVEAGLNGNKESCLPTTL